VWINLVETQADIGHYSDPLLRFNRETTVILSLYLTITCSSLTQTSGAASHSARRTTLATLAIYLLTTLLLDGSPAFATEPPGGPDDLTGTWLVEPQSPPGVAMIDTVSFEKGAKGISGKWNSRSNGPSAELALIEISWHPPMLTFRFAGAPSGPIWKGSLIATDHLQLGFTASDGTVIQTRQLRRINRAELAQLQADLPHDLITRPLPLPPLKDVPSNGLALTPIMGWNSWNHFRQSVDDAAIRSMADAMGSSGLRAAGYVYVDIDDGWQGRRDRQGILHPNSKFPDMKALADYVHSKGLKLGIYNSPGPLSCAGYVGTHGFEAEDAKTFASWGVDLLKYDWCSAGAIYKTQPQMQAVYQKMGMALQASGRPIVYSLCQYGLFDVGRWGRKVGGNLWRTGGDTVEGARWDALSSRFEEDGHAEDSGPGGWNDPDMMLIGNGGLTTEEYRTHMTLWVMLAAPLILGNDIRTMTPEVRSILLNSDVIAVDQDKLGKQGSRVIKEGTMEVWTKPLSDGSTAVAIFNRGDRLANVDLKWSQLGLVDHQRVRDLWTHSDAGVVGDYHGKLPSHGATLLRVSTH